MKLQQLPASRGPEWVREGWRTFLRQPMAFAALFAVFMVVAFVLALLPEIGAVVMLLLLPQVTLGFMIATRIGLDGGVPTPRVFVDPLQRERSVGVALLQLAACYALATLAVLWISDWADGGAVDALLDALPVDKPGAEAAVQKLIGPRLGLGLALRFGLTGLISLPFWHAPALIFWNGQGCGQAMFSSTLAVWRNRAAFIFYGITWCALIIVFGVIGNLVFSLLGQSQLFALAAVPLSLVFTTTFYVSLYFTYADCFVDRVETLPGPVVRDETPPTPQPKDLE